MMISKIRLCLMIKSANLALSDIQLMVSHTSVMTTYEMKVRPVSFTWNLLEARKYTEDWLSVTKSHFSVTQTAQLLVFHAVKSYNLKPPKLHDFAAKHERFKSKELRCSGLSELLHVIDKNFMWTKFTSYNESSLTGPHKVTSEEKTNSIRRSLLKCGIR